MIDKFLVTSELNGTELLRSMALRGKNSFAFRVLPAVELAERALIQCGKMPVGKRVRLEEQEFVIYDLMQRVDYFTRASSFPDAVKLADTLNAVRMRFSADESAGLHRFLPLGEFADKNDALLKVYNLYMTWLSENGRIDDICLIRYAAEQADVMDAKYFVLEGFDLSPLEVALVERVSGEKYDSVSLQELFGSNPSESLRLDSLTEVYGPVNEVDRVIKDVYESGAPLDRCVVAVSDPAVYGQLFYDLAMGKGVPVSFGCGISVTNTRPAGLLSLWNQWNGVGFHGVDALRAMLYSDTFNRSVLNELLNEDADGAENKVPLTRPVELAGGMQLGTDPAVNEMRIDAWEKTLSESAEDLQWVDTVRCLGRELGLPCDQFLKKYAALRPHEDGARLDKSALNSILDLLSLPGQFPGPLSVEDMISMAFGLTVGTEQAEPGKLFVTSLSGALSSQRDHLYVLGLSADKFPGTPKENALMLDSDWELLPCPETAPTSRNRVRKTRDRLMLLDRFAASLGIDVHLYWPDYDPLELKELIPSSVIYKLRAACPGAVENREGYFPAIYSDTYAAGRLYLAGGWIPPVDENLEAPEDACEDPSRREWSPTDIDTWFGCKRQFLYKKILYLDAPEEDDPMMIISRMDIGNLAHHLMEILAEERPDEETFRTMSSSMFDDFLTARPPMDREAAEREKNRFVRMMDSAWHRDPRREVLMAEEKMHSVHPCGLKLTGRPDRVESLGDDRYMVVDFKTGEKVIQKRDDAQSCRQALIYAWMLRNEGKNVTTCEYRYLRHSQPVTCSVLPQVMAGLEEDLQRFWNGLRNGDFAPEDGYGNPRKKGDCGYCPYAAICNADKAREGVPV